MIENFVDGLSTQHKGKQDESPELTSARRKVSSLEKAKRDVLYEQSRVQ
jgi:uncharacterized protein YehS (DUF1456 family)